MKKQFDTMKTNLEAMVLRRDSHYEEAIKELNATEKVSEKLRMQLDIYDNQLTRFEKKYEAKVAELINQENEIRAMKSRLEELIQKEQKMNEKVNKQDKEMKLLKVTTGKCIKKEKKTNTQLEKKIKQLKELKTVYRQQRLLCEQAKESQRKNDEKAEELEIIEQELKLQKKVCCEKVLAYEQKNRELVARRRDVVLAARMHKQQFYQRAKAIKEKRASEHKKLEEDSLEVRSMYQEKVKELEDKVQEMSSELKNTKMKLEIVSAQKESDFQIFDKEKKNLISELKKANRNLKITMEQKLSHLEEVKAVRRENKTALAELESFKNRLDALNAQKKLYHNRVRDLEEAKRQELTSELKEISQVRTEVKCVTKVSPYRINCEFYKRCSREVRFKVDEFKQRFNALAKSLSCHSTTELSTINNIKGTEDYIEMLVRNGKKFITNLKAVKNKLDISDAKAISGILSGFNTLLLSLAKEEFKPQYFSLEVRVRNEDPRAGYIRWPVYLGSGTMEMYHSPLYYPDNNIATNYSTIWKFNRPPGSTIDGDIVESYITPGALLFLKSIERDINLYAVFFHALTRGSQPLIVCKQYEGDYFRMYVLYDAMRLYLVPLSAVSQSQRLSTSKINQRMIVACPLDLINLLDGYVWSSKDVTKEVKSYPVK